MGENSAIGEDLPERDELDMELDFLDDEESGE